MSEPRLAGRRHRPWLGASGVVLVLAMFLPAVRACDATTYPYQLPMFWPPYVIGAAFAGIGFASTPRGFLRAAWTLRGVLVLYALAAAGLCVFQPELGVVELAIALLLLGMNGLHVVPDERRVAVTAILCGGMQCVWFAPWCLDANALVGVFASLLASVGLVIGGALWASDLPSSAPLPPTPAPLPRARVVR